MYNIIKLDDEKDMDYIDCKFGLMYSEASVYMELNSEDDLPKFMKEIHKFANLRSGADVYVASGKLLNKSYELFGELAKYKNEKVKDIVIVTYNVMTDRYNKVDIDFTDLFHLALSIFYPNTTTYIYFGNEEAFNFACNLVYYLPSTEDMVNYNKKCASYTKFKGTGWYRAYSMFYEEKFEFMIDVLHTLEVAVKVDEANYNKHKTDINLHILEEDKEVLSDLITEFSYINKHF